jgi:hypothetical protein
MFDALDTIKAGAERTGGGFSVVEFLDFEGSSVPLHVINNRWDAGFHILGGEYSFVIAGETGGRRRSDRGCMCRRGLGTVGGAIHSRPGS